jgi:hypothetical protein
MENDKRKKEEESAKGKELSHELCPMCGKSFTTEQALWSHKYRFHVDGIKGAGYGKPSGNGAVKEPRYGK